MIEGNRISRYDSDWCPIIHQSSSFYLTVFTSSHIFLVGVRTSPRGSVMVSSTGWCHFSTIILAGFCPTMSYGSRKRSYDQEGCVRRVYNLRLRRIMSSLSQTLRRRLVRTTATDAAVSARLDAVRRGFIFHTSRLVRSL